MSERTLAEAGESHVAVGTSGKHCSSVVEKLHYLRHAATGGTTTLVLATHHGSTLAMSVRLAIAMYDKKSYYVLEQNSVMY